ncbi:MAG TPA: SpoIVB peptidase S55 domain-containing protein [Bryobacteraceae bacterium]|nr:SpoIVB peptidase S55 domain-containing protein [Bryobacteraceae bacterium]
MGTARTFAAALLAVSTAGAAPPIFPLKDVRAGQHGVGRTVFSGSRVEEFQVEILGVLENIGPKQSIILARLSGGPLAQTGVMQGMSGSPVYIDGKLAGAVALGFELAKEPICGIRPIEEMLRVEPEPKQQRASVSPRGQFLSGDTRLTEIATPVSFSGFTAATLEQFAPQLRQLGLDPRQGVSGGGRLPEALGDPKKIEPGSMISVQLLSGDMNVGADGTVTMIDGNKVFAFGHRLLSAGETELPFARSEVLALLPNLSSSFKISQPREWMGTITEDRNSAISGLTGRRARMTPIEIKIGSNSYRMGLIQDRVLTPLVAQMAVFSAIDATARTIGAASYTVRGKLNFESGSVKLDNVYSGDVSVSTLASAGIATPLSYALASGFDALKLKDISIEIGALDQRRQMQIADLMAPRRARPGEEIEIGVVFSGENGAETTRKVRYRVPVGAETGPLYLTASDATSANLVGMQAAYGTAFRSPSQVLDVLNGLHTNTSAYLRVWRAGPSYTVEGRNLPDPPASIAMILGRAQPGGPSQLNVRGAELAEMEVASGGNVVTGSKTIQIEVRE